MQQNQQTSTQCSFLRKVCGSQAPSHFNTPRECKPSSTETDNNSPNKVANQRYIKQNETLWHLQTFPFFEPRILTHLKNLNGRNHPSRPFSSVRPNADGCWVVCEVQRSGLGSLSRWGDKDDRFTGCEKHGLDSSVEWTLLFLKFWYMKSISLWLYTHYINLHSHFIILLSIEGAKRCQLFSSSKPRCRTWSGRNPCGYR